MMYSESSEFPRAPEGEEGRHLMRNKPVWEFAGRARSNFSRRAMEAIDLLEISQLNRPLGYKDPDAPKRNREQLRKDQ